MSEFKISSRAYTKLIFHAAKFPHCAVNGILLAEKESSGKKPLIIADAIPLFHQCLFLTPMAEIALAQIESMADSEGLVIAGYYAGSELYHENSIDKTPGLKLADKIAENFNHACCAVIDNKILTLNHSKPAISVYRHSDNRWTHGTFSLENSKVTLEAVSALLKKGAMKDIVDFDNHLDNPEIDWTNSSLNHDLGQLLAMY